MDKSTVGSTIIRISKDLERLMSASVLQIELEVSSLEHSLILLDPKRCKDILDKAKQQASEFEHPDLELPEYAKVRLIRYHTILSETLRGPKYRSDQKYDN
jgi:hypothetical protein